MATLVALVVAFGGPPSLVLLARWFFGPTPPLGALLVFQLVYCGFAAFVVWTVLKRERRPLTSIGLRAPGWSTLITGAGLWLVSFIILPVITGRLRAWAGADPTIGLRALLAEPLWFRLLQAITGGPIEEVLYRGYPIERLTTMTGRRWFAVVVASLAFGVAHAPGWGLRYALVADLPFGLVASLCYAWRRDLSANMLAHTAGLIAGVLSFGS